MENKDETFYLIMDSNSTPLACAIRETPPDADRWQVQVLNSKADLVVRTKVVQLISMDDNAPDLLGKVIRQRNNRVILEPLRKLGEEVRQNLRIQTKFNSFIYPVSGKWKGRLPVIGKNLSCGGVSFFCTYPLETGELVEIVLPVTEQPLVVKCQILRPCPTSESMNLYATKFIDLIYEEIKMIREAVFYIQIQNRDDCNRRKGKERNRNVEQ